MDNKIIKALQAINWEDVAMRAIWTFLQVFGAVFIVAGEDIIDVIFTGDWANAWALIFTTGLSAVAAGLSAVKTILVGVIRELRAQV